MVRHVNSKAEYLGIARRLARDYQPELRDQGEPVAREIAAAALATPHSTTPAGDNQGTSSLSLGGVTRTVPGAGLCPVSVVEYSNFDPEAETLVEAAVTALTSDILAALETEPPRRTLSAVFPPYLFF